jgi:hypothetical protein
MFRQSEIFIREHNVNRVPTVVVDGEIVRNPTLPELERLLAP